MMKLNKKVQEDDKKMESLMTCECSWKTTHNLELMKNLYCTRICLEDMRFNCTQKKIKLMKHMKKIIN